ncbi:ankyrin repeat-containing protein [Colletotrichum tofieldiae]|nr:ankyrin repeat-containing protein [Colletotrichum tofieldiae]GKT74859.1 ankyrin repeat-containing protein [Colletotrichum tofieldiae]GKT92058.1 ankyrin repeat-containing protein [Colletotrichum tofieldiae]
MTAAKIVNEQKSLHQRSEDRIAQMVSLDVSSQLANITKQLQTLKPQGTRDGNKTEYIVVRSKTTWRGPRLPSYKPTPTGQLATASCKNRNEWSLSLQLPAWISEAVWEIQVCWSMTGGWQQSLRSFSVRSRHSAIFAVVRKGDVEGMMAMFSKGEASPLDRDENGSTLLYYATDYEQIEVCRTLLDLGLEDHIDDNGGSADANIPTLTIERMFDFETECSYADDWLRVFQRNFLPGYHDLPLQDRAEAVRLGAFTMQDVLAYRRLLNQDGTITRDDVRASAEAGFSLVHSAAAALGKRFAHEMQFNPRLGRDEDEDVPVEDDEESDEWRMPMVRFRAWVESWSHAFTETLRAAERKHLHGVETVVPWDCYRVPVWTGTPLISVLGGALCRISPDLPWRKWDTVFRGILRQWLRDLRDADVDLLEYGRDEALKVKFTMPGVKGAFDADAIAASRTHVRSSLRMRESWMQVVDDHHPRSDLYWLPVRIVGLDYGPRLEDWRLWWAPEFEAFAAEFWAGINRPRQAMPGSWVDS